MLHDVVTWWIGHMRPWLPERLRQPGRGAADALVVEADDVARPARVVLTLRRRGRERAWGQFALDGADGAGRGALQAAVVRARVPAVLLLPAGLLLEREVELPLAAEREPERVLDYEMDRIAPFTSADLIWTYAILRRDRVRQRLHVWLSMVPRASVAPLLAALTAAGLVPAALEVPTAGGLRRITLARRPARGALRRASAALAGLCAALAVAAAGLPLVLQARALARTDKLIVALQPRVDAVQALRRQLAAGSAGLDVISAEQRRLGDPLAVLATVTALLPDDTSLSDLTLRQGKLVMRGQSAAAARLITALSASAVIRDPDFAAPVTRVADGHADLFAIQAELARP